MAEQIEERLRAARRYILPHVPIQLWDLPPACSAPTEDRERLDLWLTLVQGIVTAPLAERGRRYPILDCAWLTTKEAGGGARRCSYRVRWGPHPGEDVEVIGVRMKMDFLTHRPRNVSKVVCEFNGYRVIPGQPGGLEVFVEVCYTCVCSHNPAGLAPVPRAQHLPRVADHRGLRPA